jgi:hypothetical protein
MDQEVSLVMHNQPSLMHCGHTSPLFCKVLLGRHKGAQQQQHPSVNNVKMGNHLKHADLELYN